MSELINKLRRANKKVAKHKELSESHEEVSTIEKKTRLKIRQPFILKHQISSFNFLFLFILITEREQPENRTQTKPCDDRKG